MSHPICNFRFRSAINYYYFLVEEESQKRRRKKLAACESNAHQINSKINGNKNYQAKDAFHNVHWKCNVGGARIPTKTLCRISVFSSRVSTKPREKLKLVVWFFLFHTILSSVSELPWFVCKRDKNRWNDTNDSMMEGGWKKLCKNNLWDAIRFLSIFILQFLWCCLAGVAIAAVIIIVVWIRCLSQHSARARTHHIHTHTFCRCTDIPFATTISFSFDATRYFLSLVCEFAVRSLHTFAIPFHCCAAFFFPFFYYYHIILAPRTTFYYVVSMVQKQSQMLLLLLICSCVVVIYRFTFNCGVLLTMFFSLFALYFVSIHLFPLFLSTTMSLQRRVWFTNPLALHFFCCYFLCMMKKNSCFSLSLSLPRVCMLLLSPFFPYFHAFVSISFFSSFTSIWACLSKLFILILFLGSRSPFLLDWFYMCIFLQCSVVVCVQIFTCGSWLRFFIFELFSMAWFDRTSVRMVEDDKTTESKNKPQWF